MDMVSSADDNTPDTLSAELDATLKRLKDCIIEIYEWFHKKSFKFNIDKCNFITVSKSKEEIQVGETSLTIINRVKLLVIHIDGRLNFVYHVSQLCKKAI